MKSPIVTTALALALAAPAAAQQAAAPNGLPSRPRIQAGSQPGAPAYLSPKRPNFQPTPPASGPSATSPAGGGEQQAQGGASKADQKVFKSNSVLPAPLSMENIPDPTIALPDERLDGLLLQPEHGPFMVMAYTFRGPDAVRFAKALVLELRGSFQLPAYIFYAKVHPGHSNIRGVQPTADPHVRNGDMAAPERYRNYDEAAVLVGNCKTIDEAKHLRQKVKRLHPETLQGLPSIYTFRKGKGLSRATFTTNPLVPSQRLFPGDKDRGGDHHVLLKQGQTYDPFVAATALETEEKPDPLLKRMNSGPRSVLKCPGPYVLQVSEFMGRTAIANDESAVSRLSLQKSPLAEAADHAERLSDTIAKCKSLNPRLKPYVYHDRTSSKVYLGPFQSSNDPALAELVGYPQDPTHQLRQIDKLSNELSHYRLMNPFLAPPINNQLTPVPRAD